MRETETMQDRLKAFEDATRELIALRSRFSTNESGLCGHCDNRFGAVIAKLRALLEKQEAGLMTYSLEQLKALESVATAGPWEHRIDNSWSHPDRVIDSIWPSQPKDDDEKRVRWTVVRDEDIDSHIGQARQDSDAADYDFIAAARTAVPELIAEVERLQGELSSVHSRSPLTRGPVSE